MVTATDNGSEAGTSGPESNVGGIDASGSEQRSVAGAIDPDAARIGGVEGTGTDDFAASFADAGAGTTATSAPGANATRTKRKYTRRTQTGEQPGARKEAPLNINGVEKILFSLHAFASLVVPELAIDESESKKLASAIENVSEQYKVTLDPKVAAYIDLATTCGMIYGPRAVAIWVRKTSEAKPPQQQRDNVTPIRPAPNPTPPRPQPTTGAAFDPGRIIDGPPLQ